jgi:NitT/TauT family transport system substrate-binding protein
MKIFRAWLTWLMLAALPWLSGCDKATEPFRVGTNIWIGYESLFLAQHKGYYDDTPVRMVTMHNATEVQHALRAGVLEAAALTLDEVLALKQDGMDVKIVLVMDASHGADVLMARPEIATLAKLKGKRIGVESTAVGAVMLQGALAVAGLAVTDVQLVHLTIDQHAAAYQNGKVDAVVTFDPVRTQLLAAGAKILFDSSRIPDRVVDVLVTTSAVAARHPHVLRQLVAGHFRALADLRANPLEAAQSMTRRQGISAEEILASYLGLRIPELADNRRFLAMPNPALGPAAAQLANLMLEYKLLKHPVNVEDLFDDRFLPQK